MPKLREQRGQHDRSLVMHEFHQALFAQPVGFAVTVAGVRQSRRSRSLRASCSGKSFHMETDPRPSCSITIVGSVAGRGVRQRLEALSIQRSPRFDVRATPANEAPLVPPQLWYDSGTARWSKRTFPAEGHP